MKFGGDLQLVLGVRVVRVHFEVEYIVPLIIKNGHLGLLIEQEKLIIRVSMAQKRDIFRLFNDRLNQNQTDK